MLLPTLLTLVLLCVTTTFGAPQIALPFNAQVPSVARVSQPYSYQFSPSTFTSSTGEQLTYSLQNTPIWLQINSTTRTLYGTPESSNLGPLIFNLLADDGSGRTSMQATLVVVNSSAPQVGNITEAIASDGPLSDTTTLSLRTGSPFSISMRNIFSSVNRPLYYATSIDNSPLPSWVQFDPTSLSFSGSTPTVLSAPQTYGISLHVSTVEGFSEASATFSLAVGSHQLYFIPVQSGVNIVASSSFLLSVLKNALNLDNKTATSHSISMITFSGPDWISFNNETLSLSGKPPLGAVSQNVTFTAHDIYGDTAVSHLALVVPSETASSPHLINGLSAINVTIGEYFSYSLPQSSFAITNFSASLIIPEGYPWLTFVASNLTVHGNVPGRLTPGLLATNFTISSNPNNTTQSSLLDIIFYCSNGKTGKDGACESADSTSSSTHHLSTGAAAAIGVVATLIALLFLLALAYLLYRTISNDQPKSRPWISRPIGAGGRWKSDHPYGVGGPETDDERSLGTTNASTRHERIQSDGTFLEPADVDAITAMNRTSLGTDALHKPRKLDSNTKKPPAHIWDKRSGSHKIQPRIVADAFRAKLGSIRMPGQLSRWASTRSRSRAGPAPSLRIWAANRTQGSVDDDIHNTLATPSMSSIGNVTDYHMTHLETATPQTMTAFHYPKPSTTSQRPPPPIPSRSTDRGADIRLVSVALTAATPPQLPPIHSLASMTTQDTRPVHEKRQSYIRNRASDRNKGGRDALFAAGGGLDEDADRGRSGRFLAVPKRSVKLLSRSRSSSLGIGVGSRLPASITEGSVSEFGRTEDWITVRDDDGDVYEDVVGEERARQDKRMKWRNRLNRNSKGQVRGGDPFEEENGAGRENRHARTQSWIRQALSPTRLKRLSQQSPTRHTAIDEEGGGRLLDDRMVSAATQASSTRAFL